MDDNHSGHSCECPTSCEEMLNDPKFEISNKGKELLDEYDVEHEDIKIQFSSEKVCATNGIAYKSECSMRIAACNQQQHLEVANMGECGKFCHVPYTNVCYVSILVGFSDTLNSNFVIYILYVAIGMLKMKVYSKLIMFSSTSVVLRQIIT